MGLSRIFLLRRIYICILDWCLVFISFFYILLSPSSFFFASFGFRAVCSRREGIFQSFRLIFSHFSNAFLGLTISFFVCREKEGWYIVYFYINIGVVFYILLNYVVIIIAKERKILIFDVTIHYIALRFVCSNVNHRIIKIILSTYQFILGQQSWCSWWRSN